MASDDTAALDREQIMEQWDRWRAAILKDEGSWPRDAFEAVLDGFYDEIERLTRERDEERQAWQETHQSLLSALADRDRLRAALQDTNP